MNVNQAVSCYLNPLNHSARRLLTFLNLIPTQCLCIALFFLLYHKFLSYWMRTASVNLGAVKFHRHVVPLYAQPQTDLSIWILPALVVLTVFLLLCRRIFLQRSVSSTWLFLISIGFFLVISISVAMIDGYREVAGQQLPAFLEPYTRTRYEYYGDVPKVDQIGFLSFMRDYAKPELFATLSGHAQTHPPGGILFLWIVSKLFGYNLLAASLGSIVFTSLTVIPIYLLAKELYGESIGRYALALFLITPNFVMFTGTSMDGPFSVFPILSLYLFYRGILSDRAIRYGFLTGISLGCGMLMTYSTVFIGLFFNVVMLLTLIADRGRFRRTLTLLLIAGVTFTTFYLLIFLVTGFNLLEALQASIRKDKEALGNRIRDNWAIPALERRESVCFSDWGWHTDDNRVVSADCGDDSGRTAWRANQHLHRWLSNLVVGDCLFYTFHNGGRTGLDFYGTFYPHPCSKISQPAGYS